jgi:pimeloyl-ACP methyl ester carboxylesterase
MPTVQLRDVAVNYQIAGSGEPVVFIPGFATSLRLWDRQIESVSNSYRCVRYDLRGHGESSAPPEGYGTADFAQDLVLLTEHLNLPRSHLVAASMGGAIAVHLALERPELVRSLTLAGAVVDGFEGWGDDYTARLRRARKIAKTEGVDAALRDWMTHPFFGATRDTGSLEKDVIKYSGAGWLTSVRGAQAVKTDFARLVEIEKPTLVVVGDADVDPCQAIAQEIAARVRSAKRVVIPGAGHLPSWDKPEEFNAALLDFLGAISAPHRPKVP